MRKYEVKIDKFISGTQSFLFDDFTADGESAYIVAKTACSNLLRLIKTGCEYVIDVESVSEPKDRAVVEITKYGDARIYFNEK